MPCTRASRFHFCTLAALLVLGCGSDDDLERSMSPVDAAVRDAAAGANTSEGGASGGGSDAGASGSDAGTNGSDAGTNGSDAGTSGSGPGVSDASVAAADAARAQDAGDAGTASVGERFSFFVTSEVAIVALSGNAEGFGGDLRHGETGEGAGLRGADKICTEIAERSMPGSGAKQWRAFLSAAAGGANGGPVHARDRIGAGPWYDRLGRLVGNGLTDLLSGSRPSMAHALIRDDLPNETGTPNSAPDGTPVDNHDTLTGSDASGRYLSGSNTCMDWTNSSTSTTGGGGGGPGGGNGPSIGHSWPRGAGGGNGSQWIAAHRAGGCGRGINTANITSDGTPTVGSGGGYGGFYCFALTP
jgi:hypothetical protein